jgi:hypothetical protein
MPKPKAVPTKAAPVSVTDLLVGVLFAVAAAWLVLNVDHYLVSNYATARFWETWVEAGSSLHTWVPLISFGLITGIGVGVIIGLVFPAYIELKIAAIAAVMQLVVSIFTGSIASGIFIAIGLLTGALPSRVTR